jgi:signal peptidase
MARRPALDAEDDDAGVDEPEDEAASAETPRRPRGKAKKPAKSARAAPKRWSIEGDDDEGSAEVVRATEAEEDEEEPGVFHRTKRPVFYRARDTWWFEPLVALMIILVLLAGLYAYTQNWPPLYVVESESMQHGLDDHVGLINTGDLVLAQSIATSAIVPYVVGMQTGYTTYGEYGDVLLYHPDGDTAPAPIIHRALLYLSYNPNGSFDASDLRGLPCGTAADHAYESDTGGGCGTVGIRGTLELFDIGWQSVSVNITLGDIGTHSGFVTMGDNNIEPGTSTGVEDEPGLTSLVEPGWIVGVARGMVPWVGAVKLLLGGDANEVPSQSWAFLGLSIVAIFALGALVHFGLRAEGVEDDRRKALEEEEAAAANSAPPGRFRGLRSWFARDEADDDPPEDADQAPPPRRGRRPARAPSPALPPGGRPRPRVRRDRSSEADSESAPKRPPGGDADDGL